MSDLAPQLPVVSTRDKLLDAAQQLLVQKGFALTSVEEICTSARATKGAFFHYFKSKEDMALAALERFARVRLTQMLAGSERWPDDPVERLYTYVSHVARESVRGEGALGCLIAVLVMELGATHETFREACHRAFSGWIGELAKLIDGARATLPDPDRVSTAELANEFLALYEGSIVLARAASDLAIVEKNLMLYQAQLRVIFGHPAARQAAG